jgi:hypothetical protein
VRSWRGDDGCVHLGTRLHHFSFLAAVPPPTSLLPAGKSTYLRQAGLLHVLAHVGCFVPASYASFRLTDRLATRLGTGDDMEANASTFLKEVGAVEPKPQRQRVPSQLGKRLAQTTYRRPSRPACTPLASSHYRHRR